jgi:hypothetical protein
LDKGSTGYDRHEDGEVNDREKLHGPKTPRRRERERERER